MTFTSTYSQLAASLAGALVASSLFLSAAIGQLPLV